MKQYSMLVLEPILEAFVMRGRGLSNEFAFTYTTGGQR